MRSKFETLRENSRQRHQKFRDSAPRSKIIRDLSQTLPSFRDRANFSEGEEDRRRFLFDPMDWLLPGIKPLQAIFSFNLTRNFPRGVLLYISYIGMCCSIGQGSPPFWSEKGCTLCPVWSGIGYDFRGELRERMNVFTGTGIYRFNSK